MLILAGTAARVVMLLAQRQQLREVSREAPGELPPVTILRPVRGLDPGFEENLRSLFRQDYPNFEIVVGARDAGDPALAVARKVAAEFPRRRCVVVADRREVGPNPKVANLANMFTHASYDLVLISDANVRVHPQTLRNMVAELCKPGVGLVSSPIRGALPESLGGAVDALLLNTFVMGGASAVHRILSGVCVVGKSMMLRRETLQAMGGFAYLARFLAEDQVSGEEVRRLGLKVALCSLPVDNVTGAGSLGHVAGRYVRWAKIRRRMAPAGFAGEVLLFPLALATLSALAFPGVAAAGLWLGVLAVELFLARMALVVVGERWAWRRFLPALLVAQHLALVAWASAWLSREVRWRGTCYRIGRRTRLEARQRPGGGVVQRALQVETA